MGRTLGIVVGLVAVPMTARAADREPPILTHQPCSEYRTGHGFTVEVRIEDASPLFDPKVIFRSPPASSWKSVALTPTARGDAYTVTFEADQLRGPLDYFIEVFDENGNGPATVGSDERPVRVLPVSQPGVCTQVPGEPGPIDAAVSADPGAGVPAADVQPEPRPQALSAPAAEQDACSGPHPAVTCSPWFWGIAGGVVAVGLGVAIVLALPGDERIADFADLEISVRSGMDVGVVRW